MDGKKKRIGILGGTFNPIHNGHLILAETARSVFALDEVWLMPSGCSYMKDPTEILDKNIRAELVSYAVADNPSFCVSYVEIEREGNSYTCETLAALKDGHPNFHYFYIIGADILFQIESWKNPREIFKNATVIVALRGEVSFESLQHQADKLTGMYQADIRFLPTFHIEISSTVIRKYCREHRSIRYLVPEPVRKYLEEKNCYR